MQKGTAHRQREEEAPREEKKEDRIVKGKEHVKNWISI